MVFEVRCELFGLMTVLRDGLAEKSSKSPPVDFPHPAAISWATWWWLPPLWGVVGVLLMLQPWFWGWMDWDRAWRFGLVEWGPWLALGPGVIWLTWRCPLIGNRWHRSLVVHLVACMVMVFALDQMRRIGLGDFGPEQNMPRDEEMWDRGPEDRGPHMDGPDMLPWLISMRLTVPLYALLVASGHVWLFQRRARVREQRAAQAEAQLVEAQLAALQLQLQPHFLFNCLNAISALVHTQPDTAEEMICALAELLRATLATRDRREVALADELALTQRYLAIQQIRFADRLEVQWHIDPAVRDAAVPPLLLQPLLENAIVHGLAGRAGLVRLDAEQKGGRLILTVTDRAEEAVPQRGQGSGSRVGLGNTRARLETLYGAQAVLTLTCGEDGAEARLEFPYRPLS